MKKHKAAVRKKLKIHIRKKGENTDFYVTESFCLYWWHQLNEAVFDGMLTPPVRFEIKNFRNTGGWCRPFAWNRKQRRVLIGISDAIWERKTFLQVLAHEMVHQWEWEVLCKWDSNIQHGKDFFDWRGKIRYRAGLPLTKTIDI